MAGMPTIPNNLRFVANFLQHPLQNASLVPSSSSASKAMLDGIDFSAISTIVELGPGTGVFTKEILKHCRPDTKILLVELEESYITMLRAEFGERVVISNQSAHLLDAILAQHGIDKVDLIVSGLPFSLPTDITEKLFASIGRYTERGAIFRFFTYNPPLMKRVYKSLPIKQVSFVLKNIPPMWVYGIH